MAAGFSESSPNARSLGWEEPASHDPPVWPPGVSPSFLGKEGQWRWWCVPHQSFTLWQGFFHIMSCTILSMGVGFLRVQSLHRNQCWQFFSIHQMYTLAITRAEYILICIFNCWCRKSKIFLSLHSQNCTLKRTLFPEKIPYSSIQENTD